MPEGNGRGGLAGVEPIGGQSSKEIVPLALDGVFFFGNSNVSPGQFFVHEIHDQRVFDGFPAAFGFRGFVSDSLISRDKRCSTMGGKRSGVEHGILLLRVSKIIVNQLLTHYQKEG